MADANVDIRELCSLYCFYSILEEDRVPIQDPITKKSDIRTIDANILKVWSDLSDKDEIFAFQHQGPTLKNYLKSIGMTNYSNFKYGIFEKSMSPLGNLIPQSKRTDIYDKIWQKFTQKHRSLFRTKKDTWNPADVYIYNGNNESGILSDIENIKQETEDLEPVVFVALVNEYLKTLYKNKELIGISLKKATWPNIPKATETNTKLDDEFEAPKFGEAKFTTKVHQWMEVKKDGRELGFRGNSLTFECQVSMDGGSMKKYSWESKSPSMSGFHATEMKDLVASSPKPNSPLKKAGARTGSIPIGKFENLITEFSGNRVNHNIPTGANETLDDREIAYWTGFLKQVKLSPLVDIGDTYITHPVTNRKTDPDDYIRDLAWIDAHTPAEVEQIYGIKKESKFRQNFRGKLRGLRYMKAIINANRQDKLGEFLIKAYYYASKIQYSTDDLEGPFVKIQ